MPAIELAQVHKSFGSVQAVRDVTLNISPGEVVAFLGPNGAGKTTTISMMLGMRTPSSGDVRLFGFSPRDRRARSRCGVMLQESGVPETLKVRELVDLFRAYYPAPLSADQAIEMAGLQEKSGARFGTLSGGQRQRLYFALAVCGDPDALFLDEPTVALDVEGRREFWTQVRTFISSGKTIVLTTHYLEEADAVAGRVIVIDRGRVIADDTPAGIKSRVAGKRVSFDTPLPLTERELHDLPVQTLEQTASHITMLSNEPELLLQSLIARDIDFKNLEVVGAGLEEAFLNLTGENEGRQ